MFSQIQATLNNQFFSIADGTAFGLPDWDLVYKIADYVVREPTAVNIQYATDVYNAIQDLKSIVERFYFQVVRVDFNSKTYEVVKYSMPVTTPGHTINEPSTIKYQGDQMEKIFANIEEYNRSAKIYEVPKYQILIQNGDLVSNIDPDNSEVIRHWANCEDVIGNIDDVYLKTIDKNAPVCSFERFLKLYNYTPSAQSSLSIELLEGKRMTIPQIALKLAYEKVEVSLENANEIIKKYGWNSGAALYNTYKNCRTPSQRTSPPINETRTKLSNKIKNHIIVIEHLTGEIKEKAIQELKILKSHVLEN